MKEEIKRLWVSALKSGEYKQGQRKLVNSDKSEYCCLGVLCDLYHKETGLGRWISMDFVGDDDLCANGILPLEVARWAELSDTNPAVTQDGVYRSLTFVNDRKDGNIGFEKIADLINESL